MTYLRKIGPLDFIKTDSLPAYKSVSDGMLSVVIPSCFLRKADGNLWLDAAVESIRQQEGLENRAYEIIVGIDGDAVIPPDAENLPVTFARAELNAMRCQASSLNAALKMATGDIIGFLDDDDMWFPQRLKYGLHDLQYADVLSATALNYNLANGDMSTSNHYSIPSGWLMRRQTQVDLGLLDENIRFYTDAEYIGRMNKMGLLRIMQVRIALNSNIEQLSPMLDAFLKNASLSSAMHFLPNNIYLVLKTVHDDALTLEGNTVCSEFAEQNMASIISRYGHHPY